MSMEGGPISTNGHGSLPHTPVADQMQKMTGAMQYLERKSVKRVLRELTEALLVDQPDDPAAYIVEALKVGWPSQGCAILPNGHSPRREAGEAPVAALSSSSTQVSPQSTTASFRDIAAEALSVSSSFLEAAAEGPRCVVSRLLNSAAAAMGVTLDFYSAPGGVGREESGGSDFCLVASSNSAASIGQAATDPETVETLRSALEAGIFGKRLQAAGVVRTGVRGIEGLLLLRAPSSGSQWAADCGALSLLPPLRLWCLMLADRLEMMVWRTQAEVSAAALQAARVAMERLAQNGRSADMGSATEGMVPQQLLVGNVTPEAVGLWTYNPTTRDMVLQVDFEQVEFDREYLQAAKPTVMEAATKRQLVSASRHSAANPGAAPGPGIVCVPIQEVNRSRSKAVVQLAVRSLDYFNLAGAEALKGPVLRDVLRMRDCVLQLLQSERQYQALETMLLDLSSTTSIVEVVEVVERDVPQVLDCDKCTLYFLDDEVQEIWSPPSVHVPTGIRLAIGEGVVGHVAMQAMANPQIAGVHACNDPKSLDHWQGEAADGYTVHNLMTAPVWSGKSEKRLISLIQVINKHGSGCGKAVCTESCKCGNIFMADARFCRRCGTKRPKSERAITSSKPANIGDEDEVDNFTQKDCDLLEVLAKELGAGIQHLMLDMLWTKARMDTHPESPTNNQNPSLLAEYYREDGKIQTVISSIDTITLARRAFWMRGNELEGDSGLPPGLEQLLDNSPVEPPADPLCNPEKVDISNWMVDYWEVSEFEEFHLVWQALRRCSVFDELTVRNTTLWHFFQAVKRGYRPNPYHNFQHAMSTVHYAFKILETADLNKNLDIADSFAVVIGGLCHDLDHRGRNNAFEMMTRSELALRYNDSSVLENHHAARAFEIALGCGKEANRNIFQDLKPEVFAVVRKHIVAGILSTDMKQHGHHVQIMRDFDMQPDKPLAQRQFLVELAMHLADIGNPLMPPQNASRWSKEIAEEFASQADDEERLGLPVTSFMVGLREEQAGAKSLLGFIDFVLFPLASSMFRTFPGFSQPRLYLEENRLTAQAIVDPSKAREQREALAMDKKKTDAR